jgi:hypothetical protein
MGGRFRGIDALLERTRARSLQPQNHIAVVLSEFTATATRARALDGTRQTSAGHVVWASMAPRVLPDVDARRRRRRTGRGAGRRGSGATIGTTWASWRHHSPACRARRRSGLPIKEKNFLFCCSIRKPSAHSPGPTTSTTVRDARPLQKKVAGSQRDDNDKGEEMSLLATFIIYRGGGLAARPWSCCRIGRRPENARDVGARRACVVDLWGRGDEPLTGLTVLRLRASGARVLAVRMGAAAGRLVRGTAIGNEDVPDTRFARV